MKNPMPRLVHVQDSTSNRTAVDILKKFPPLHEVEFCFIPGNPVSASDILQTIKGRAVLIWDDGNSHLLSKFLDIPGATKRIIDNHDDYDSGHGFSDITYANHAFFSELSGCDIQLALTTWCRDYVNFLSRLPAAKSKNTTKIKELTVPLDAPFNGAPLHLSVDLDAVLFFPAVSRWMTFDGFSGEDILSALRMAVSTGQLERLDFGGLAPGFPLLLADGFNGHIPDIRSPPDFGKTNPDDARKIARWSENASTMENNPHRLGDISTKVSHYALYLYYQILAISMF
ncbi:hypothetical protein KKB44_02985 [Candidatus Micrarchaeota archaeon]|nr:hypothetical protein [Candidatus Micrarchaeota archaeon]